jgi:hypothetical protein
MSSEHKRETAFLRRCISYEESNEGRQLDQRIAQIQRDERSLRRATWVTILVTALLGFGFAYMVFLIEDLPNHISQFAAEFISKTVCALGIGSLVSLLAFGWLGIRNRRDLNLRREECRLLVLTLLECQLGKLPATSQNVDLKEFTARILRQAGEGGGGAGKPAAATAAVKRLRKS